MSRDDEFVRETRASVRQLTNGLVELERDGSSRELVDELFRTAHSLKGNCSMAGLDGASRLAHAVEDFLSALRDGSLTPNPDLTDAALAAVDDIDAILQESNDGDVATDPESSVSVLRAEMDRYRDESRSGTGIASDSAGETEPASDPLDEPPDEFDQTVVDALESASGFDDLEGLLAEMDDPGDADGQPRWGTFDNRTSSPASGGPESEQNGTRETPSGKIESSGSMDEFDAIKSGVKRDDVSSLDHELADIEFGEFDDDDELSIQDLIDGEVADEDLPDEDVAEDATDAVPDDHPASSPATAETTSADDTIRPEDFGYNSVDPSTPDDTASADEPSSSEADGVTVSDTAGVDDSNPFEGIDIADPDDESGADYVSSVGNDGIVDVDSGVSDETTDEPEAVADEPESVTASSSDVDVPAAGQDADGEPDISFPDGKTFDPEGEERDEDVGGDADDEPATGTPAPEGESEPAESEPTDPEPAAAETPDFTATFEDDDGGPVTGFDDDEFGDEYLSEAFGEGDTDFATDDAEADLSDELPGDDIDLSDDEFSDDAVEVDTEFFEETPEDDISETLSDEFDDDLTLPQDFLSESLDVESGPGSADTAETTSDGIEVATEGDIEDLDLPDVDLPDVDDLAGISLSTDDTGSVSFERDEHTMAFESRFAERFGGSSGDDKIQLVQVASSTIEESSLDAARYQSSGTAEYPLDFGDTRESDRIQSLTVDVENADSLLNLVEELSLTQLRIKQSDDDDIDDHLSVMDSVTGELRRAVMNLRLMPLSTAIDGLPRVVRDIARTQDKEVAFEVSDEGVDLDRSIVEKIGDPLVHLVRNAVDHGIEPPEERQKQGKPREGTIELRAWRDREHVVIEVEDDGRGISAERIRQQAIDYGLISREQAERMSFDEVYDLVFEPGFSTAEEVTDVSGRGVGMDAVRRTVNSLDGTVDLESEPGSGTTVRVRLPVSVAVSKMLFVGVGPEQYAIPASIVADVELVDVADLGDDGTVAVEWPDETADRPGRIPYRRLSEALGVAGDTEGADGQSQAADGDADDPREAETPAGIPPGKRVLVRLGPESRELALVCDEVDDAREVVVKPYEKLLGDVPGISGATMSGDGTLVNIIDVTTL